MRRRVSLTLLLLCFATSAQAQSTSLFMWSDPGDYIGQGETYLYAPGDGTFIAGRNSANGVTTSFNTPTYSHFWQLDFAAPHGLLLAPGFYTGAARFPFQPPELPGLAVYGDGRGCNTLTGSFEVLEVAYGTGDEILAFRARFEQHCEGFAPALRGEIRFNATVPVELTAPSQVSVVEGSNLSFQVSAVEINGGPVVLSASGVPAGASFVDNGNNTGSFSWTPTTGQAGAYVAAFHGANSAGLTETVFTRITVRPPSPPNDDIADAIPVSTLPFGLTQDTSTATVEFDDPFCNGMNATVWFAFKSESALRVEADTFGSGYDTTLSVYTGSRGSLAQIACNDNADGTAQSRVRFDAAPGVTYYFMVSAFGFGQGGPLTFNVKEGPPPLSINPSVYRFGTLSLTTGVAELSGSVSCSQPTFVSVFGQLRQEHAGTVLNGYFSAFVPCDGTADWQTVVYVPSGVFQGRAAALLVAGPATVTATMSAFDPETGEFVQRNLVADVILRGGR